MPHVDGLGVLFDRERGAALYGRRELPHVARPLGRCEGRARREREREIVARGLRDVGGERVGERRDVLRALAQRRHADRQHVQAVVQVLAEALLLDGLQQIDVGRGDDAHVGFGGRVGAERDSTCATAGTAGAWLATASGISPISSRNSVPPCAAAILPGMRRVAVECAPFSAPNSSLSKSVSGSAAQLISTNGPRARASLSWSARAIAVLPVPLSPLISTVPSTDAATESC